MPPPERLLPAAVVIPVMVPLPVPGKVCPATNVTRPVLATLKTVPLTARGLSVELGNRVRVSRMSVLPLTSRDAAGAVVLMPIPDAF